MEIISPRKTKERYTAKTGLGYDMVLVFANQKGGVGKTTSAVNIASGLGLLGKKVLLVDSDPQCNASSAVGVARRRVRASVYDVLIGRADIKDAIAPTGFKGLDVIPSSASLAGAEFELADLDRRERRLADALDTVKGNYDYVIIDCPPSLGLLTVNALVAGDGAVIPMQCEYFALEGLSQITSTIAKVRKLYNPSLLLSGIIFTMYNGRLNLSLQIVDEIKKYYGDKILLPPVPRSVRISEAPSHGKPIQYYDRYSKGAEAYDLLSKEILKL